jgi:hypothetical protein
VDGASYAPLMMQQRVKCGSWFEALGGWTNLMQGLGSAIVGGIVAAAVALLVVRLTHKGTRSMTAMAEARAAVRNILNASTKVGLDVLDLNEKAESSDWTIGRWVGPLMRIRLELSAAVASDLPSIAVVDAKFQDELGRLVATVVVALEVTSKRIDETLKNPAEAVAGSSKEALDVGKAVGDVIGATDKWLRGKWEAPTGHEKKGDPDSPDT